ncbi:metallophosphoesterase [Phenylobacterium sp.]|uniref:metallophosphoesterase family protein n=1 Tax=Phenylobacterium sp. TaxID=1871053 RepID=UPI002C08B9BF|nr:metallophosphoesterase [Phenylobacterium sp.]HVI32876.1 metallophosphoesterase [Phenylobacterium sp.]
MPHFRLAHLSDPHLPPPDLRPGWRDIASKRLLSRIAWRRKRHRHRPEVLAGLVADVRAQAPDHVALTGDLTNFSTPEEFAAARAWLEGIGPTEAVTVSPGNHDALVRSRGDDPFSAWREWLGDDPAEAFPKVRVRGEVALINLCSAVPTALHLAQGRLGEPQVARLAQVLREQGEAGRFRLVLVHHPIAEGAVSGRKALTDATALRAVLAREGAELVLHGHAHEALVTRVAGPTGAIPVLGVPSASAAADGHGEAARWHGLEIARAGDGFEIGVVARGLTPGGGFGELGRYRLRSPARR